MKKAAFALILTLLSTQTFAAGAAAGASSAVSAAAGTVVPAAAGLATALAAVGVGIVSNDGTEVTTNTAN